MANIDILNNDVGNVILERGEFDDDVVEFAATDLFAEGTILARNTSNDKLQLFVKGGIVNGNGVPVAILTYDLDHTGGAGDETARVMVSGVVTKERLIIDADGDDSNIDGAVRDLLRQTGIVPVDVDQLAQVDNPQP